MNPKVNIILATYNGEQFIEQQLDSIMNQTYDNIDIYVRDDGSKDNTVSVINKYKEKSSRKIYLLENGGMNLRCPGSFYEILNRCEKAEYYALCDQDDIWYPQKIQWAVEKMEREQKDIPLLYYTACDYSTERGEVIRKSPKQKKNMQLKDVLFYTPGSGFTMVLNEKARQDFVVNAKPGPELHDRWLARCAVCFGKLLYDERSSASHIRHEAAVTSGDAGNDSLIANFIKAELCGDDAEKEKEALRYFYEFFKDKLTEDEKKLLKIFCDKNSFAGWWKKVFYPGRLRTRFPGELALRLLFMIGKI